jgi:hypothetical protein
LFGQSSALNILWLTRLILKKWKKCVLDSLLVLRGPSDGPNPVYYVLGQTSTGRYLFCVIIHFPDGNGYPVTARPMTVKEERRYREWKKT